MQRRRQQLFPATRFTLFSVRPSPVRRWSSYSFYIHAHPAKLMLHQAHRDRDTTMRARPRHHLPATLAWSIDCAEPSCVTWIESSTCSGGSTQMAMARSLDKSFARPCRCSCSGYCAAQQRQHMRADHQKVSRRWRKHATKSCGQVARWMRCSSR